MNSSVAWVTGGGTGIGRALAEALYREGYKVVISGRRKDVLDQTAREIASMQGTGEIWSASGDASDAGYVSRLLRSIHERWGDVDLMINNAGANTFHSFQETPPEEFEQTFRINCMSAIYCTSAVLPGMRSRRSGVIVNVSSILGKSASSTSASYSMSKFALAGYTDALRQELAGSGVHVMGVYPGFIRTPLTMPTVRPGSLRSKMGKSPEAMAAVILKGVKCRKRDILYPWYVPWVLHLDHWFPGTIDTLRKKFGR